MTNASMDPESAAPLSRPTSPGRPDRAARWGFLVTVGLGVLAACVSPFLARMWGWEAVLPVAAAVGAAAGPFLMLFIVGRILPGEAPGRAAFTTLAGGIVGAAALALIGRGSFGFIFMGLIGGVSIVFPLYLAVIAWVVVGVARSDANVLTRARNGVVVAAILGMLTWALPAGVIVNTWDVNRAKAFVEKLATSVEEEKARTGLYPAHEEIEAFASGTGSLPSLLSEGFHYYAGEDTFQIGFQDRTAMFGMYEFHGTTRQWDHWVD